MDRVGEPQGSGPVVFSGVHLAGLQFVRVPLAPTGVGTQDEFRKTHPGGKFSGRCRDQALREGEDGGRVHETAGDRMEPVGRGEGNLHPEAEELTHSARVDHHVPRGRRPEFLGQSGELKPLIRGSRWIRRVEQQHGLPACADMGGESGGLGFQQIEPGSGDDHDGCILRDSDFPLLDPLEQRQLGNFVVRLFES